MISVNELKRWLAGLRDDDFVGMDKDSLTLYTTDGNASIEIGGLPIEIGGLPKEDE